VQVFCQPPLATVGYTEAECVAKFAGELDVYTSKFKPMKNTLSGREDRTLMKMIVHRDSDKVVGVHMVGEDAAEIMQVCTLRLCARRSCL
jgi:glutathione reductase (NADPH)